MGQAMPARKFRINTKLIVSRYFPFCSFFTILFTVFDFNLSRLLSSYFQANLPLLQRELLHCARMAKQTPQQYLTQNEHVLFNAAPSVSETSDSSPTELNENGKRQSPVDRSVFSKWHKVLDTQNYCYIDP